MLQKRIVYDFADAFAVSIYLVQQFTLKAI